MGDTPKPTADKARGKLDLKTILTIVGLVLGVGGGVGVVGVITFIAHGYALAAEQLETARLQNNALRVEAAEQQAEAAADIDAALLQNELLRLEVERMEKASELSQQPVLTTKVTVGNPVFIRALPNGLSKYQVKAGIRFKNDSQVKIRASLVVFDFYVAVLPDDLPPAAQSTMVVGMPTLDRCRKVAGTGSLKWDLVATWAGINDDLKQPCKKTLNLNGIELVKHGFGVSDFLPGHTSQFSGRLDFDAPPGSILGIAVCGVNDDCDWAWRTWDVRELP